MGNLSKNKKITAVVSGGIVAAALAIGGTILSPKPIIDNKPTTEEVSVISVTPSISTTPKPSPTKTPKPTKKAIIELEATPTKAPPTLLELFAISGKTVVKSTYNIEKIDDIRSKLSVNIPESLSADIYELYLNEQFVDKELLPKGTIVAPPLVFTEPKLLYIRVYKLGEVIGIGYFEDGVLRIMVKDGVINE